MLSKAVIEGLPQLPGRHIHAFISIREKAQTNAHTKVDPALPRAEDSCVPLGGM